MEINGHRRFLGNLGIGKTRKKGVLLVPLPISIFIFAFVHLLYLAVFVCPSVSRLYVRLFSDCLSVRLSVHLSVIPMVPENIFHKILL